MATKRKSKIHDAKDEVKDFFRDESMKRIYPKNPYNVAWFLDQMPK